MLNKPIDLLAIGDLTTDAFIRLKDAAVHCRLNTEDCELCLRFGDKVPFEYVKVVKAVGNAANAAVAGARLGLKAALVTNVGDDQNGRECVAELQKNSVVTSFVKTHKDRSTNYHFVLWYESDRTILVNHIEYDYALPYTTIKASSDFEPEQNLSSIIPTLQKDSTARVEKSANFKEVLKALHKVKKDKSTLVSLKESTEKKDPKKKKDPSVTDPADDIPSFAVQVIRKDDYSLQEAGNILLESINLSEKK